MLDKQLARDLLPLVNDVTSMTLVEAYVKSRIEKLKDGLVDDPSHHPEYFRGAIHEMKRFLSLRDEANTDSKDKPKS